MSFFDFMMSYYGYETKAEIILVIIFGIIGILFSELIIYYGIEYIMGKEDEKIIVKNDEMQEDQNDFFIEGIENLEDINISSLSKGES